MLRTSLQELIEVKEVFASCALGIEGHLKRGSRSRERQPSSTRRCRTEKVGLTPSCKRRTRGTHRFKTRSVARRGELDQMLVPVKQTYPCYLALYDGTCELMGKVLWPEKA